MAIIHNLYAIKIHFGDKYQVFGILYISVIWPKIANIVKISFICGTKNEVNKSVLEFNQVLSQIHSYCCDWIGFYLCIPKLFNDFKNRFLLIPFIHLNYLLFCVEFNIQVFQELIYLFFWSTLLNPRIFCLLCTSQNFETRVLKRSYTIFCDLVVFTFTKAYWFISFDPVIIFFTQLFFTIRKLDAMSLYYWVYSTFNACAVAIDWNIFHNVYIIMLVRLWSSSIWGPILQRNHKLEVHVIIFHIAFFVFKFWLNGFNCSILIGHNFSKKSKRKHK